MNLIKFFKVQFILIVVLIPQPIWSSTLNKNKYKNFDFRPSYGIGIHSLKQKRASLPIDLVNTYIKFFNAQDDFSKGIKAFAEFDNGKYAIMSGSYTNDNKLKNKFSSCDFKGDGSSSYLTKCGVLFGTLDVKESKVVRLNNPSTLELSGLGMFAQGGPTAREGYRIYGCQVNNPFAYQDLNLDGNPELFVFGSIGEYWGEDEGGIVASTSVYIYYLDNDKQPVIGFKQKIAEESFWPGNKNILSNYKVDYQSFTIAQLTEDGLTINTPPSQGVRKYSKLYFKDFDQNGKLDILLWGRSYRSRLKSDLIKGYKLEKDWYGLYEETGKSFIEKEINNKQGKKLLKEHALNWQQGFPHKNHCAWANETDPLIETYDDPQHNIDNITIKLN